MTWRHGPSLLKHFLQALLVYMAVYTCLSRVSDYKHHWSDVLGGSLIGATVGLLTVRQCYAFLSKIELSNIYSADDRQLSLVQVFE